MKKLAWFVLIALGVLGTLVALLASGRPQNAIAVGIVSIAVWSAFGAIVAHYTGLRRKLLRHLGGRFRAMDAQVVSQLVGANDRPNLQLALNAIRARRDPPRPLLGHQPRHVTPDALITANPMPVPVEWERFPKSLTESIDCAINAVYLLHHGDEPYVAVLQPKSDQSRGAVNLSVLARSRELAQAALDEVLVQAESLSVYRGAVVSLEPAPKGSANPGGYSHGSSDAGGDGREAYTIRFHDLQQVDRSQIILPEEVLEAVDRNVLGLLAHSRVLRRAGRGIRHGVLLHGPPGTGKTLVVKYLARACRDFTVILLTGRNLRFVRQSCRLARLLAPSMVVMEDVDLVAVDRRRSRNTTVLHWLMDEMDGLGPQAETIFLLTTNRPAVLEQALTARPGRVDQAIYFPLPDAECRRRLFTHFSDGLDVSGVDPESLIARTDGASPAFLQELFRKAALMAAERGERSDPLRVTGADFDRAIRELVELGGDLTRSLLGFTSGAAPDRAT